MKVHSRWHKERLMNQYTSLNDQIQWHIAHQSTCGCCPIPQKVKLVIKRRKIHC